MGDIDFYRMLLRPGQESWAGKEISEDCPCVVSVQDVTEMLEACLLGDLSMGELVDWANLILFNDAFEFEGELLRDTLDRIEESDEPGNELSPSDLESMIDALHDAVS